MANEKRNKEEKRARKKERKERKITTQMEKIAEELKPIRNYFVRLFGKIQFKNEGQFLFFGKWMVLLLLLIVEVLMILQNFLKKYTKVVKESI